MNFLNTMVYNYTIVLLNINTGVCQSVLSSTDGIHTYLKTGIWHCTFSMGDVNFVMQYMVHTPESACSPVHYSIWTQTHEEKTSCKFNASNMMYCGILVSSEVDFHWTDLLSTQGVVLVIVICGEYKWPGVWDQQLHLLVAGSRLYHFRYDFQMHHKYSRCIILYLPMHWLVLCHIWSNTASQPCSKQH